MGARARARPSRTPPRRPRFAQGDAGVAQPQIAHDAPEMDYPEHEKTYAMFVGLAKWGTIFMVLLLIFMAVFLL